VVTFSLKTEIKHLVTLKVSQIEARNLGRTCQVKAGLPDFSC
jgi:hypothetical protein